MKHSSYHDYIKNPPHEGVQSPKSADTLFQRCVLHAEDGVADEYYLNPGDTSKNEFDANANALNTILETLTQQGDSYDHTLANSLLATQKFYILRAYQFFFMVDAHNTQSRFFYNSQVDPLSLPLSTNLAAELTTDHQETIRRASQLKMTEQIVAISLALLFLYSMLLLGIGSTMLRKYQRELVQARQTEWPNALDATVSALPMIMR